MNLGASIRHGAAWLFIGNTGSQIAGFLLGIILARILAPQDFGAILTIQVFTGLAGFVAGGGMGQALVRSKEAGRQDYDVVFTLQLAICCLIYGGFFLIAPSFADWYNNPLYAQLLRVSALSFLIRPFVNLPGAMLSREMRFKEQSIVNLARPFVTNAVAISMGLMGYGVWSLSISGLVGAVVSASIMIYLTDWRPRINLDLKRGEELARYGFLVSINDIVVYLRQQASVFILSRTFGPAFVGLYNKGDSLAKMPHGFITGSVYQVLFRALAKEHDDLDKSRYLFFRSITLVAVYATPFYIGFAWLAKPFIITLYGAKWAASSTPLAILAFAWPFWLLDNLSGAVLAARNWLERELLVQVSMLIIISLAIIIGLPYGLSGIAAGVVLASIYNSLHMYWLVCRALKARFSDLFKALAPATLLNFLLLGALFLIQHALPQSILETNGIYLMIMTLFGGLTYVLAFFYLPIPAIKTEATRWKTRLHLSKQGQQETT